MTAPSLQPVQLAPDSGTVSDAVSGISTHRPRLGFLGVGWIGRHRMGAIARDGGADIVGICDGSPIAAAEATRSAALDGSVIVESFTGLLERQLDGLVIATPSALHAAQAIAALERGIAVFCQKPLARTAAETRRVVDAARANDRLLGVDLSYRFTDGMRRIRELVQSSALGRVYAIDLVFHNAYGPDKPWFFDPALSGGGCVIDLGIHLVDLALWTLGFPRVVEATGKLYARGRPLDPQVPAVEDYATASLVLDDDTSIRLTCSWNLPAGCDAVISAAFYGTAGGAALRNVNGSFVDFVAERFTGTSRETLAAPPDDWGGRAAVAWTHRLAAHPGYDADIEHLVSVAAALDGIYGR
jgi:predicted dehydrogenase